jgi:hypothetical protein
MALYRAIGIGCRERQVKDRSGILPHLRKRTHVVKLTLIDAWVQGSTFKVPIADREL